MGIHAQKTDRGTIAKRVNVQLVCGCSSVIRSALPVLSCKRHSPTWPQPATAGESAGSNVRIRICHLLPLLESKTQYQATSTRGMVMTVMHERGPCRGTCASPLRQHTEHAGAQSPTDRTRRPDTDHASCVMESFPSSTHASSRTYSGRAGGSASREEAKRQNAEQERDCNGCDTSMCES